MNQKKAIILLSGGLDSATVVAMVEADGYVCYTMSLDYGRRHRVELQATECVARRLGVIGHKMMGLDPNGMGGSALIGKSIAVPESPGEGIPVICALARSTVFLSLTLGQAEVLDAHDIFIDMNAANYSGYPGYRPEFVRTFERMADPAIKAGVRGNSSRIQASLQYLLKVRIIQADVVRGMDYGLMVSCYQADEQGHACGKYNNCRLRADGFAVAGISDPTPYF